MYLKRLDIYGFKTFADRTELIFPQGITAIVGPNGSGKSNISDAIQWVLGEQNVRQLRGTRAVDVIFSGSEKRRPLGMAEVSLTIDNSTGLLPVDFSEVTITRRAYRSGEGEFYINRTPCRLKDIFELFLDTGVGREAYSIINQSEIDALLSVRPEDRRQLFEEAAGIKKYRHRKKEASRKLEATQANLLRVNDIISEIEGQIEPMREQAEVARRYNELAGRLRAGELRILANDFNRLNTQREKIAEEIQGLERLIEELTNREEALGLEEQALKLKLTETDSKLDQLRHKHEEAAGRVERVQGEIALATQKRDAAEKAIAQVEAEMAGTADRLTRNAERVQEAAEREAKHRAEAERLSAELDSRNEALESALKALADALAIAESRKSDYIELARQLAGKRNELANREAELKGLRESLHRLDLEAKAAQQELSVVAGRLSEAEAQVAATREQIESLTARAAELAKQREEKSARLQALRQEIEALQTTLNARSSRMLALQEMQDAFEGFHQGVRSTMLAARVGELKGGFHVVAEILKVPKELETAIEVALGNSLQDIIAEDEAQVKQAIGFLKRTQGGRATFLPLSLMRPVVKTRLLLECSQLEGVLGLAVDLVRFDDRFFPAMDVLLGKIIIAEHIDAALEASRAITGWHRVVTPEGELLAPTGAITGGSHTGRGTGLLARKRELEELKEEVARLTGKLRKMESEAQEIGAELAQIMADESECARGIGERRMSLAKTEKDLEHLKKETARLTQLVQRVQGERQGAADSLEAALATHEALKGEIESLSEQNASLDAWMAQNQEEINRLGAERDKLSGEITAMRVAIAAENEKASAARREQEQLAAARKELESASTSLVSQKEEQARLKSEAEARLAELEASQQGAAADVDKLDQEIGALRDERTAILDSTAETTEAIKQAGADRTNARERIHALEIKDTQASSDIAHIEDRLREEYELTPEQAALEAQDESVKSITYAEVARLRREVREMGAVNTGAVEEYERISERFEFLTRQREDLEKARAGLLQVIREIDESTKVTFMDTFRAIADAFAMMFQRLFGGGRTELQLTDPSDLLETGIEVIVQPPGKKLQNLQLLSGGERALTASALLFALLTVKPSPFCVMDEVDAPLDESNVGRFGEVLQEFARKSQFIMVTHNKTTMETADVLYGVTMREPGVSTVMSVQLSEVQAARE